MTQKSFTVDYSAVCFLYREIHWQWLAEVSTFSVLPMLFSVAIAYHYLEEGILMLLRGFMATLNADFENLL